MLRSVGRALVAQDAPASADWVVIATDVPGPGVLEAADLVHAGFTSRVAVFDRPVSAVDRELIRRGAEPPRIIELAIRQLHELGVQHIELIPPVVGTVDEGKVLRDWCVAHSIHSILFVAATDHSRRARRVLDRALERHGIQVTVRYARFSEFDPDHWWESRSGQRTLLIEAQKLLLDLVVHPF